MLVNLKGERILRLRETLLRTGLSRSTLYELIRKNEFPSSVSIGARAVGWMDSEISAWISARAATRRPPRG
ncbi:hypothetical protein CCAX7_46280 [Capsulimonas corticalis]|uniref:Uncharacterized protein n=1 Tax=Capsulimonas corticalis TaxID=2219043 RepID=A0A402D535_9BACT|nr:AlpA family transcriptional regulator [Capsulimonas corticalis]BDI32577.1 hypothetical protein CCAX7_46280 [Capsulimonas corticalis]